MHDETAPALPARDRRAAAATDATALEDRLTVEDWRIVGPFQGQREPSVDHLAPAGGEAAIATGEADAEGDVPSALVPGGSTAWRDAQATDGTLEVAFDDVLDPTDDAVYPLAGEDSLADWYGRGVGRGRWYAVGTVTVDGPRRAVVETDARACYVNGRRHGDGPRGEESNASTAPPGVVLHAGENRVLLRGRVGLDDAEADLSFELRPPRAPVEANFPDAFKGEPQNLVVPDLVAGEPLDRPLSVRVTNTTAERVAPTVTVAADADAVETVTTTVDPPLTPFETRRVETRLRTDGDAPADRDAVSLTATVETGGEADDVTVDATVRDPGERRRETFVSDVDGSVAEYSVQPPTDPDADGEFAAALALHGATVPSINMAGAVDAREGLYVCSGAARGPLNFNHDGFGRLDDLEALDVFRERYPVDDDRVVLTGHSMGGHGTWHVGLSHPDRFAAIAPSAGYGELHRYVTRPFARRQMHGDPSRRATADRGLQGLLALPRTENLADGTLPAFVLHGAADEEVPAFHARTIARGLANRGLDVSTAVGERHPDPDPEAHDVATLEVPGADHWWDFDIEGDGADAVNHPDMWSFLRACERDPHPAHVRFVTSDLGVEDAKHWVRVVAQREVHRRTTVDARLDGDGLTVDATNVAVLAVDTAALDANDGDGTVTVGDRTATLPDADGEAFLDLRGGLSVADSDPTAGDGLRKTADRYGPQGKVLSHPYRLVYGTAGSAAQTELNRELACGFGRRLVDTARAHGTVIPDTGVTGATHEDYNLLLFGRPDTNSVLADLAADLPVSVGDGEVTVGERTYRGDYAAEFVSPNPRNEDRLVRVASGTSPEGLRLTRRAPRHYANGWFVAAVDYAVYGEAVRTRGWDGTVASGFFDRRWQVDESLGHLERRN